jgi:flagellar biosynthesis protein FlhF
MNIQRFTAATSREAMAKARNAFGDSAVILSSRATDDGFEVMAASEESLAPMAASAPIAPRGERIAPIATRRSGARPVRPPMFEDEDSSVEADTEALAMSTLSFQDYVRERMLRKRRGETVEPHTQAVAQPEKRTERTLPRAEAAEPVARANISAPSPVRPAPVQHLAPQEQAIQPAPAVQRAAHAAVPMQAMHAVPPPIRTQANDVPHWEASANHASFGSATQAPTSNVSSEIKALKDLMEERFNTLAWVGNTRQNPVQAQLMLKLIRAGYSPAMARSVLERVPATSAVSDAQRWVRDTIHRNVKTAGPGKNLCDEGGVVALIGATGVGKTTTAAKIAAQCVKQYGPSSVGLITLDTYRVAGYEQLRAYGRMLGVVAHLAHDRAALKDLLALLANKRMVIIDTAGLGQRDQRIQDMFDVLDMPEIKKVLVLNAGSHGDTLDDVLSAFKANTLHGVVLSKIDEAVKLGPSIDALIRHQVVLRGVANGQRVPEDWQDADASALVRVSLDNDSKAAFDPLPTEMGMYFSQASSLGIDLGASHV